MDQFPHYNNPMVLFSGKLFFIKLFLLIFLFFFSGSKALLHASNDNERNEAIEHVKEIGLNASDPEAMDQLLHRASSHRLVLLGEASHGTSEYYTWRAEISKRLIEDHGFDFIIVEGDWPIFFYVNKYVKHKDDADESSAVVLSRFERWPKWMWANEEVLELVDWLREYNERQTSGDRAGFYGLDVYSYEYGMEQVVSFIQEADPDNRRSVQNRYQCLSRYRSIEAYLQMVHQSRDHCGDDMEWVSGYLESHRGILSEYDSLAYLNARQNARMAVYAERHLRANLEQGSASWNHRVDHFFDAAKQMLDQYGEASKGIVWAHNTHVGDARATSMRHSGRHNIGQLARESLGEENVYIIGFGTYRGEVLAGRQWEGRMETMVVPNALEGSYEDIMQQAGMTPLLLKFGDPSEHRPLITPRGNRAIGVVYQPERDHESNYVATILPVRYNAFIFFEETSPLSPLD